MSEDTQSRSPALDPIDRVSEIVFGTLMALSFSGALSVATAGREQVRTMMLTALGCNLAWGLTDAVMYLVRVAIDRHRKVALLQRLHAPQDDRDAHALIAEALPPLLAAAAPTSTLDALRRQLLAAPIPSKRLGRDDFVAALGVFVLVVLATFPVVIPFMLISGTQPALRVSNLLALCVLFVSGYALGHYAGGRPWPYGLAMAGIGVALVAAIMALGG